MDDLEHSVLIAERDWESFYEESEECCIDQVMLADLDDSGLSDDNEYISTQETPLSLQAKPDEPREEHGAAAQRQSSADDREARNLSKDSVCFCYETDLEQTAQISLNDNTSTGACSTSGHISSGGFQNNTSETKNSKEPEQSQGHVTNQPITGTLPPCIQETGQVTIIERESVTEVMEGSATPRKEKERWFVTVNDSPVQLKVYTDTAGQKKRRKKKSSRRSGHQSRASGGQCPHSNNEKDVEEEKIKEGQKTNKKLQLPIQKYFSTFPDNAKIISSSTNIQQVVLPAAQEPEEDCKKSSIPHIYCTSVEQLFTDENKHSALESNNTLDLPPENLGNPSASLDSPSPTILTSDLQHNALNNFKTQLANDQSTVMDTTIKSKSNIDITTQNQSMTNNLSHVDNLKASSTSDVLDKLHQEQDNSIQSYKDDKMSFPQTEVKEPLNENLETSVDPTRPIYALSSFWDEMERLTINDILHLRVANTRPPLSISVNSEENDVHLQEDLLDSKDSSQQYSSMFDVDSADSDYFTHLDDSKPDRSSCEFSTFSDFDDEFLQIINTSANPTPEPQSVKEQTVESTCTPELLSEELELTMKSEMETEDILTLCCQDRTGLYLYPAEETQNLFLIQNPDSNVCKSPFQLDSFRKTPSPVLSVGSVLDDQHLLNLSEMFAEDFDGDGLQISTPDFCNSVVSFYSPKKLSLPETYDDFFSDFEVGNLLFPSVQDQLVPIFSSSRSVVRDLMFPEVEELIETDIEDDYSPIQVKTPFSNQTDSPQGTPNFYFYTSQKRNWRSLFSLRRITFTGMGRDWCQKVSAWIFPDEARKVTSYVSGAQSKPYLFHMEDKTFIQFAEHQQHVQQAPTVSKKEGFLFSIKQADMCLVCIAFASWVLKTSNSHSSDMWKTALLANVSAISAIQYLRQYVKKEATEDDP